jgi:hypothetical protein
VFRRGQWGTFVRDRHLANDRKANRSYGERDGNVEKFPLPVAGRRYSGRPLQQATKEGEGQRDGVGDEVGAGGAGGNNLESSSSTRAAKVASRGRQTGRWS